MSSHCLLSSIPFGWVCRSYSAKRYSLLCCWSHQIELWDFRADQISSHSTAKSFMAIARWKQQQCDELKETTHKIRTLFLSILLWWTDHKVIASALGYKRCKDLWHLITEVGELFDPYWDKQLDHFRSQQFSNQKKAPKAINPSREVFLKPLL